MNILAFVLIVGSALFHATWNLLAKRGRLTVAYYAVMELTTTLCWSHVLLWSPVRLSGMPPRMRRTSPAGGRRGFPFREAARIPCHNIWQRGKLAKRKVAEW